MLHPPCLCLWPMSLIDFVLCTVLHTGSRQLTIDQSGSVDDSEKDARIAHRRSFCASGVKFADTDMPASMAFSDRRNYLPCYTSVVEVHQWKKESPYGNTEWIDEEISAFESTILDFGPELRTKAP
ncbi:hypothetical protein JB92DRAFT_2826741 [Gautieria morchelliformis]|nr:hypothetical protein JB92DRAFT_2826741 [Gautieria morchelliformis]